MFLRTKIGFLSQIIERSIKKAGSVRKLEKETRIPKVALFHYQKERRLIRKERLIQLFNFLEEKYDESKIEKELPSNWRQLEAGKKSVLARKNKGIFQEQMKKCHQGAQKSLKKWHHDMKRDHAEEYYNIQYERFKKAGGYNYKTLKGEKVRNNLEKQFADFLISRDISYEYEPLIKIGEKYFFPDFLVEKKTIVECTAWKGESKAIQLKKKIESLKKVYSCYILVPRKLSHYYKIIEKDLIYEPKEILSKPIGQNIIFK